MQKDLEANRFEVSPGLLTRILVDPEVAMLATGFQFQPAMEAIYFSKYKKDFFSNKKYC